MLKAFRIISFIEGLSFIALLFIAMPAKYGFDTDLVRIAGPVHGMLWLVFVPLLMLVSERHGWSDKFQRYAFITSIIPFGCFALERKFRQDVTPSG